MKMSEEHFRRQQRALDADYLEHLASFGTVDLFGFDCGSDKGVEWKLSIKTESHNRSTEWVFTGKSLADVISSAMDCNEFAINEPPVDGLLESEY